MNKITTIHGEATRGKRALLKMIDDIWEDKYKDFFDKIEKGIKEQNKKGDKING